MFSTHQVASKAGVHRDTLLRWLREGKISEPQRNRNGWRVFNPKEVEKIVAYASKANEAVMLADAGEEYHPRDHEKIARLRSIDWDFDTAKTNYLTHALHPYPAKYIPQIPRNIIRELASTGDTVLDPFCGSGTTLVEALRLECNAVGIDANPLACLISRAKTSQLTVDDAQQLTSLAEEVIAVKGEIVHKALSLFSEEASPLTYANNRIPFAGADEWFDAQAITELTYIKERCLGLANPVLRDLALTAFSSIVVTVSRQDSDTRYVRREKSFKAGDALTLFSRALNGAIQRSLEFSEEVSDRVTARIYTSSILTPPDIGLVDLVVCSPPYPNAYSYHLYHRTRMLWLGMDQPQFKQEEIGSHRKYSSKSKNAATVHTFRSELITILEWLRSTLRSNRYACFVIGDSILNGQKIENDQLLIEAAQECGFKLEANIIRNLKSSKKSFNPAVGKIRDEHLVLLKNSTAQTV